MDREREEISDFKELILKHPELWDEVEKILRNNPDEPAPLTH